MFHILPDDGTMFYILSDVGTKFYIFSDNFPASNSIA